MKAKTGNMCKSTHQIEQDVYFQLYQMPWAQYMDSYNGFQITYWEVLNLVYFEKRVSSFQATNTWLQKTSKDVPYAQILQDKLSGLQELNIQKISLPVITIPEELFLKR